jgi:methionyl-tRNA formyltransferase
MAIINNEKRTGITIQVMEEALDSGDMIFQKSILINPKETGETLFEKLQDITKKNISKVISDWTKGKITLKKQSHSKATYCYQKDISKKAARISWKEKAEIIERKIRAFYPRVVAWTTFKSSDSWRRMKIFQADLKRVNLEKAPGMSIIKKQRLYIQTGSGMLLPQEVQQEGKQRMSISNFLQGVKTALKFR